ncbi:hypothetical protein F66182_15403 [Fusarium sp. NRRL 66182]|nr:hypothetical protein F66182_15403 [Fusarium sp. NRRL 66182]
MIPLVQSFIALALASIACIASASASSTLTSTVPSSTSTPSRIEVDVIFPIQNATYNDTESLPVVFALQNPKAASAYSPFLFTWGIVPYYGQSNTFTLPEDPNINAYWQSRFTSADTTTELYVIVNQTDVQEWPYGVFYEEKAYSFQLQWEILWLSYNYSTVTGTIIFNVLLNSSEPDLGSLVGTCPQLGGSYQLSGENSCPVVTNNTAIANPCAIDLNATTVASISSGVQSLIAASAAAASVSASASAAAASAAAASKPSSTAHNSAFGPNVPMSYMFLASALSTFQMMMYL